MDHAMVASPILESTASHSRSSSGSISISSPATSMFSRAHSTRSPASSISMASSPVPARESFDLYGSTKRLEDVREEPHEREEEWTLNDEKAFHVTRYANASMDSTSPRTSLHHTEYSLGESDFWPMTSTNPAPFKRQRSTENRHRISDRFTSRFGSLSRRWKNRSSIGPQLSIITHTVLPNQRSSSATSSQIISPALSAISKHESFLPASPVQSSVDDSWQDRTVGPSYLEDGPQTPIQEEQEQRLATTPLLPPALLQLSKLQESPLHSPLQSPSIAATAFWVGTSTSIDEGSQILPSPPLSHQASKASIQRTRDISAHLMDIPPLQLLDDDTDPWAFRLGHANFSIYPEPYDPESLDLASYTQFRANWDLARKQYAQHLARTNEHYGETSKVYRLTQEKWSSIDNEWRKRDSVFYQVLSPTLTQLSDSDSNQLDSPVAANVLEKPLTRVFVPPMDKSGKFPEIGDADIIGPLSVAPARAPELQKRSPQFPPGSPRRRHLLRCFSDILSRHH